MKKAFGIIFLYGALSAQASFVYQNGSNFMTTTDLDGDGLSDIVLLNGDDATVQVGYQVNATNTVWSPPRSLGLARVTGMTCGHILSDPFDVLAVTDPILNRLHFYQLNNKTQTLQSIAAYIPGFVGLKRIAVADVGGAGNTPFADIVALSTMNGINPDWGTTVRSDGTNLTTLSSSTSGKWTHLNEVETFSGHNDFSLLEETNSTFILRLFDLSSGSMVPIDGIDTELSNNPAYTCLPPGSGTAQFPVWEQSNSVLHIFKTEDHGGTVAFSDHVEYDLNTPISSVQPVHGDGTVYLAVVFTNGNAAIYSYDGNSAPVLMQTLMPPTGMHFAGILPLGANSLITISSVSGDISGELSVNCRNFSGESFVSINTQTLSSKSHQSHANVMTFKNEPFVNKNPQRLQLLHADDWSSNSGIHAGTVTSTAETDSGSLLGLQNPHSVSLGTAHSNALYTIENQRRSNISFFSLEPARGENVATITIFPSPGLYAQSVSVSFSSDSGSTIYYRTAATNDWFPYTTPFTLFKNTTVSYFAYTGTKQSILRDAVYTFTQSPSALDSDGDGIPDYVELANGLNPVSSGTDSDGDGFSDLDELLTGTSPTNKADFPSGRVEQGSVYDMALTPRPYDGVEDTVTTCNVGTQLRVCSASGGMLGFAKATNLTLTVTVTNPAAYFPGLPRDPRPHFVTALTDYRFDVSSAASKNQRGVELVGIYLQPETQPGAVNYTYQHGTLSAEASGWLTVAKNTYTNITRILQVRDLGLDDTLAGLLVERKISDLLYSRGVVSNDYRSLFKGRTADKTMDGISKENLQILESAGSGGEPAYHLPEIVSTLRTGISGAANLRTLVCDIYDISSVYGSDTNYIGMYPLPISVLRDFLYTGTLQSNYLAQTSLTLSELASAHSEASELLGSIPPRPIANLTLKVATNSFASTCPVLYPVTGGTGKSLYTSKGHAYRFPNVFQLQAGSQVQLSAYTDVTWTNCPGTDPLEVITLNLTALPTASDEDKDGNLIPDAYEAMFLAGGNGITTHDSDGDGYSDLQEYLDGTDPKNAGSHGNGAPVSLIPPTVALVWQPDGSCKFEINWPHDYATPFVFTLEVTDDLKGVPFTHSKTLSPGDLSTTIDTSANTLQFYRTTMHLR